MGRDKRDLPFGASTFFHRALAAATAVFDDVIVVGPAPRDYSGTSIPDLAHEDHAPIFGIRTALAHAALGRIWIVATDYPLMTSAMLGYLRDRFRQSDHPLCVPRLDGRAHMLCAGYDALLLPRVLSKIELGDLQLKGLVDEEHTLIIEEAELEQAGSVDAFANVNTPSEYDRALETYERASRS